MALSVVGVTAPEDAWGILSSFSVIVEVEGDRAKALKGPRWVSLSFFVSFQDMVFVGTREFEVIGYVFRNRPSGDIEEEN